MFALAPRLLLCVALAVLAACGWEIEPEQTDRQGQTTDLEDLVDGYGLKLPDPATDVSYSTVSGKDSSHLGVRFQTTGEGLRYLLESMGRTEADLVPGLDPWTINPSVSQDPASYGWDLHGIPSFAGLAVDEQNDPVLLNDPTLGHYLLLVDQSGVQPIVYLEAASY